MARRQTSSQLVNRSLTSKEGTGELVETLRPVATTGASEGGQRELLDRIQEDRQAASTQIILDALHQLESGLRADVAAFHSEINNKLDRIEANLKELQSARTEEYRRQFVYAAAQLAATGTLTADQVELLKAAIREFTLGGSQNPVEPVAIRAPAAPTVRALAAATVPVYTLDRSLTTVVGVWSEYVDGINGQESVKSLDSRLHASWRRSEAERKFYRGRKIFYDAVPALAERLDITPELAAERLDSLREARGLTLSELGRQLKENGSNYYIDSVAPSSV